MIQLRGLKRLIQITSVVTLTAFFLALFLWKSDLRNVWRIMTSIEVEWLIAAFAINFAALFFRTWRWRRLIGGADPPGFYPMFFATTTGYMLSTVLPIRAGDVARPALLARRSRVRFSEALGTVLTERFLDLIAILVLFVYFCVVHWDGFAEGRMVIRGGATGAVALLAALIAFLIGLYFFTAPVRRVHQWLGGVLPRRFREPWMRFFDAFARTLSISERPVDLAFVVACTVAIWICLTAQLWVVLVGMHRPLPYDASFLITAVTTVGLAIPTPGGIGGFHKVCQWVLETFYRFDVDSSVATAVLFHVVGTLPVVVSGIALFLREGLRWKELTAEASGE